MTEYGTPNVNKELINKKHCLSGKLSLILVLLTIITVVIMNAVLPMLTMEFDILMLILSVFGLLVLVFVILTIIFGAIAYFGQRKDKFGLVGLIIGLVIIIPIVISMITYVYIGGVIGSADSPTPDVFCTVDNYNSELCVTYAGFDILWEDIQFTTNNEGANLNGCTIGTNRLNGPDIGLYGSITTGDTISINGIGDEITLTMIYVPKDEIIGSWTIQVPGHSYIQIISENLFEKVNYERRKNHLKPFIKDERFMDLAQRQSDYMALHNDLFLAKEIDGFEVDAIMDYHISMNYVGQLPLFIKLGYVDLNDEPNYLDIDDYENITLYAIQICLEEESYKDNILINGNGNDLFAGIGVSFNHTEDRYYISLLISYEQ